MSTSDDPAEKSLDAMSGGGYRGFSVLCKCKHPEWAHRKESDT